MGLSEAHDHHEHHRRDHHHHICFVLVVSFTIYIFCFILGASLKHYRANEKQDVKYKHYTVMCTLFKDKGIRGQPARGGQERSRPVQGRGFGSVSKKGRINDDDDGGGGSSGDHYNTLILSMLDNADNVLN